MGLEVRIDRFIPQKEFFCVVRWCWLSGLCWWGLLVYQAGLRKGGMPTEPKRVVGGQACHFLAVSAGQGVFCEVPVLARVVDDFAFVAPGCEGE